MTNETYKLLMSTSYGLRFEGFSWEEDARSAKIIPKGDRTEEPPASGDCSYTANTKGKN